MSRQATLFQSWSSGAQKQRSLQTGSVKDNGLQTADELGTDEVDDEDLLLAMAMEESLKHLQQPEPTARAGPPKVCSALSDAKKEVLMKKQSQLFKSVSGSGPRTSCCQPEQDAVMLDSEASPSGLLDVSNVEDLPGFDKYAGRMWIYPTNLPVREYQFSIVKEALFKNTLVVLPTGLGKTFIAAVVMYNYYRWYPQGKVIFMAPTKPLVAQQIEACYNIMGIPQEDTAEMTGAMQPTERQRIWRQRRVFFLTPQVLTNDLSRNTCPADSVKCLVVDEAHKALGNHAYCQVVRELVKYTRNFRVLALSATPGTDIKAVQQVLNNLLIAHVELRAEDSNDLQQYTYERKVEKVVVPLDDELKSVRDTFLQILDGVVSRLKRQGVLYNRETKSMSKFLILKARDAFRQNPPANLQRQQFGVIEGDFALCMSLYHGYELLQLHGLRSLYNFLEGIMSGDKACGRTRSELQKNVIFCQLYKSLKDKFDHVRSMDPNASFQSQRAPTEQKPVALGHPKMKCLETIVLEHFNKHQQDPSTSGGPSTRIMIFSQYRDSVNEISEMLSRHRPLVKVMSFVGQSSVGKSSRGFTQKEQLKVMKKFREGGYNTLVSTCVGEEGLDIGDVDLIICFDAHKSPIRLVQRMGRTGRKRKGRIVMLVTEGKEEQIYNQSQYNKRSIHKAILNGTKSLVYYPSNPLMIPKGLTPVCHKMHLTVQTDYKVSRKNKPSSLPKNSRPTLGQSITETKTGNTKERGLLSDVEWQYWLEHYKLPKTEVPFLPQSEFLTLPPLKKKSVNEGVELSLSDWMPWQNRLQPTKLTGHSEVTKLLVDIIGFMDLQSIVGADEDVYGQEMALYLNEDDILKHKKNSNHGILKFCNRLNPESSGELPSAGTSTRTGRSKRRSVVLPEFDNEPLVIDSDDDLPPVAVSFESHAGVEEVTEDKSHEDTVDKTNVTKNRNKLKTFQFVEKSSEDTSKMEHKSAIPGSHVNIEKKYKHKSEEQNCPFSSDLDADDDRDDFQADPQKDHNKKNSVSGEVFQDQTGCELSVDMRADNHSNGMAGITRTDARAGTDEEIRLSQLLPLPSTAEKRGKDLSAVKPMRIKPPPCLDEIRLTFEQFDRQGHISPVNVLELVAKWGSCNSSFDDVTSDLNESEMMFENDENVSQLGTSLIQPEVFSQDRERTAIKESPARTCVINNCFEKEKPSESNQCNTDCELPVVLRGEQDILNNEQVLRKCDHLEMTLTSCEHSVNPDVEKASSAVQIDANKSPDAKHTMNETIDTNGIRTSLLVQSGFEVDDFCEPFTMETVSENQTDKVCHDLCNKSIMHLDSSCSNIRVEHDCTSTPKHDHSCDKELLMKHNKMGTPSQFDTKDNEDDMFDDVDDCLFTDVPCEVLQSESSMVKSVANKSQLTFTQALHCLDTTMNISQNLETTHGKEKHMDNNGDRIIVDAAATEQHVKFDHETKSNDNIKSSEELMKVSENHASSQIQQPQFDLGFDLDFDVDDFEDEIVPPSPEHIIRPPTLQRLDVSSFRTQNMMTSEVDVTHSKQNDLTTVPSKAEATTCSSPPHNVKSPFKMPPRPVAVVAPSGADKMMSLKNKLAHSGREEEKSLTVSRFDTLRSSSDQHVTKTNSLEKEFQSDQNKTEFNCQDVSDEADESIIKAPSHRPRANVLASPDMTLEPERQPSETNPFKTPLKPALRTCRSVRFNKRARVSGESDQDDESPIIRAKHRKIARLPSLLMTDDDDDDDDFTEVVMPKSVKWKKGPSLYADKRIHTKKPKQSIRACSDFIDHEAALSGSDDDISSDESDGSDMDQFEASFINDVSQMSQACGTVDMRAVYLQSVRSPACRGQYKLAYGKGADLDVFSQMPDQDSEYMEDSFCVANDYQEKEVSKVRAEASILESRVRKHCEAQKLKFAELRNRRMLKGKSVDRNFTVQESHSKASEKWTAGTKRKSAIQILESSSEDDVTELDMDHHQTGAGQRIISLTSQSRLESVQQPSHQLVSSDEGSPPLLSLKSRIQQKLASAERTVTEEGQTNLNKSLQASKPQQNWPASKLLTKDVGRDPSKSMETPMFSLGLADLDIDLNDDDGLDIAPIDLDCTTEAGHLSERTTSANDKDVKQSDVKASTLAAPVISSMASKKQDVTSTVLSPPGVQSREERLRLSRLKQEEFRKKFTPQNSCRRDSGQSYSSGMSDLSSGQLDRSKSNQLKDINKDKTQGNLTGTEQVGNSSFTNIKEKLIVLVDTREITAAQNLVSMLKFNHNLHISVKSLANCDYIVSNRMAVERKTVSDFTNGANKKKLLDRLRLLCELFERPCLVVEKDRVKAGSKEPTKPLLCSKYVEHVVSCLAQTHIKLLYSDNEQETASLIAALCLQEQKKNMTISCNVELSNSQEQVLKFYLSLPKVNYVLALKLLYSFTSISEFIKSPAIVLEKKLAISQQKAKEIYLYLRHKFNPATLSV